MVDFTTVGALAALALSRPPSPMLQQRSFFPLGTRCQEAPHRSKVPYPLQFPRRYRSLPWLPLDLAGLYPFSLAPQSDWLLYAGAGAFAGHVSW